MLDINESYADFTRLRWYQFIVIQRFYVICWATLETSKASGFALYAINNVDFTKVDARLIETTHKSQVCLLTDMAHDVYG